MPRDDLFVVILLFTMSSWRVRYLLSPLLLLLAGSCLDVRPRYTFNIGRAAIWRCQQDPEWKVSDIDTGTIVLKRGRNWVELATDSHVIETSGLVDCTFLANISSLLHTERRGNIPLHVSRGVRDAVMQGAGLSADDTISLEEAWFGQYHNLTQIYSWFQKLSVDYPDTLTLNSSIGRTHYNYSIMAAHVTSKGVGQRTKPTIYLQCLLHAREWITGPVCMYLTYYLASSDDLQVRGLLEKFEFIIVPVANPDGYLLTWLDYPKYRLWRKNVSPTDSLQCSGVDLNRNFNSHWNESDGSGDPCSEVYSGPHAVSELETKAITSYLLSHAPVVGAIDFHSYYQEVLYPYAWTRDPTEHYSRMRYISQWVASAASQLGTSYTAGSMGSIYTAGGTFPDWLYDHGVQHGTGVSHCITIPLTIELRPKSLSQGNGFLAGFLVPTSEILPTCKEMVAPLVKFAQLMQSSGCDL